MGWMVFYYVVGLFDVGYIYFMFINVGVKEDVVDLVRRKFEVFYCV